MPRNLGAVGKTRVEMFELHWGVGKMKRSTKSDFFFRCPFEDSTFRHIFSEPPFYVVRRLPVAIHYPGHSRDLLWGFIQVGQDFDFGPKTQNRPVSASELFCDVQLTILLWCFGPFLVLWKLPIPSRLGFSSLRVNLKNLWNRQNKLRENPFNHWSPKSSRSDSRGLIGFLWSLDGIAKNSSCLMTQAPIKKKYSTWYQTHNYDIIPLWSPFRAGKREKKEFETIN